MMTKREHIEFTKTCPKLMATPHPAGTRSKGFKKEWVEYDTMFEENKTIFS